MADAGVSTAEQSSSVTGEASESAAVSSAAAAWHEYLSSNKETVHAEMREAREVLHTGTPSDAIELANRHVPREASDAAARWQAGTRV
jgi:hypothetical protein